MRLYAHALAGFAAGGTLIAAATLQAAEIVKLVDPSGRVIYADRALKGTRVVGTVDPEPAVGNLSAGKPPATRETETARAEAPRPEPPKAAAKQPARGDAKLAKAEPSGRQEIRWMGAEPEGRRTLNSAYTELEAATLARDLAERELREAIVPRPGETIQLNDGNSRYLPIYYERIAPFERAAMLANDRYERAQGGFRAAR